MLDIDIAIKHCLEVAEKNESKAQKIGCQFLGTTKDREATACRECAADHRQLAEWLTELKERRAADVQPVKRGRWESPVSVGNGIKFCSVCRNEAYWDTDYGQQLFDYCPYCGARMDLGDEKT